MLAFTFPGQGSQRAGMGRPWHNTPSWSLVARASDAAGTDVARLLLDADDDELRRTENAQLATFALSLVVHDAVRALGLTPGIAAGHSLGEYTALTATGCLDVEAGASLVAARGRAMQQAADERPGTMAAVLGLDAATVAAVCDQHASEVWLANDNGDGQAVIGGDSAALEAAAEPLKAAGARRLMPLPVGGAFHTPFMAPASDEVTIALGAAAFGGPDVPVVANVDATAHDAEADWPALLQAQLTAPVRWRETLGALVAAGATTIVELGPGTVLTGLARRGAPGTTARSVAEPADLDALAADLAEGAPRQADHPGSVDAEVRRATPSGHRSRETWEGEHLSAPERLIVSPCAGTFELAHGVAPGVAIDQGAVVGRVAGEEVRSPFAGSLVGIFAVAGERLTAWQRVAWMRIA